MREFRDLQDDEQTVSIDVTVRILSGSVNLVSYSVFTQVNDDWEQVADPSKARELIHRFEYLIAKELEKIGVDYDYIVAS